jgi:hypothetical protein
MTANAKQIQDKLMVLARGIKDEGITYTMPGSLKYLLYGSQPSEQATAIKMGKIGEKMIKFIIEDTADLELLRCGNQPIDEDTGKIKDLDLIWVNSITKTIYYREVKGNIELDTEKLPATIDKIIEIINKSIGPKYPDYTIDTGVFNWSVYNRKPLKKGLSQIKKCEDKGIKVEHPEELFRLLNFDWSEECYYEFWREVGEVFKK